MTNALKSRMIEVNTEPSRRRDPMTILITQKSADHKYHIRHADKFTISNTTLCGRQLTGIFYRPSTYQDEYYTILEKQEELCKTCFNNVYLAVINTTPCIYKPNTNMNWDKWIYKGYDKAKDYLVKYLCNVHSVKEDDVIYSLQHLGFYMMDFGQKARILEALNTDPDINLEFQQTKLS